MHHFEDTWHFVRLEKSGNYPNVNSYAVSDDRIIYHGRNFRVLTGVARRIGALGAIIFLHEICMIMNQVLCLWNSICWKFFINQLRVNFLTILYTVSLIVCEKMEKKTENFPCFFIALVLIVDLVAYIYNCVCYSMKLLFWRVSYSISTTFILFLIYNGILCMYLKYLRNGVSFCIKRCFSNYLSNSH